MPWAPKKKSSYHSIFFVSSSEGLFPLSSQGLRSVRASRNALRCRSLLTALLPSFYGLFSPFSFLSLWVLLSSSSSSSNDAKSSGRRHKVGLVALNPCGWSSERLGYSSVSMTLSIQQRVNANLTSALLVSTSAFSPPPPSVISLDADICVLLCRCSLSCGWRRACVGMIAFSIWETTTGAMWRFYLALISFMKKKNGSYCIKSGVSILQNQSTFLYYSVNLHPLALL